MAKKEDDAGPEVPFHGLVLFEILVRLPVADIMRDALVCPEWCDLIDTKDFRLDYARRRSPTAATAVVAMAKKEDDAGPEVPFHGLVLFEILVRLPVSDIMRGRLVCPEWCDLIDTKDFRLDYARRRSPTVLYFLRRDFALGPPEPNIPEDTARVEVQALDLAARESRLVIRFADAPAPVDGVCDFWVEGSCSGVLLISCQQRLYACNPSTHRWARLPPVHADRRIAGFYAHSSGGEASDFRVLFRTGAAMPHLTRYLTSPQGLERPIHRPMAPGSSPDLDILLMKGLRAYDDPPIVVGRSLYWRHQMDYAPFLNVIKFDTVSEVFDCIAPPLTGRPVQGSDGNWLQPTGMGHLLQSMASSPWQSLTRTLTLRGRGWMFGFYSEEAWIHVHQIVLPLPELAANGVMNVAFEDPLVFIVCNNQQLHVVTECPTNILLHSDMAGDVQAHHWRPYHFTVATGIYSRRALLSTRFFGTMGRRSMKKVTSLHFYSRVYL
ncbi:hypothetical protein ACQ4PT_056288 [Festuca glaucescens]